MPDLVRFSLQALRPVAGFRNLVLPVKRSLESEENTCKAYRSMRCISLPLDTSPALDITFKGRCWAGDTYCEPFRLEGLARSANHPNQPFHPISRNRLRKPSPSRTYANRLCTYTICADGFSPQRHKPLKGPMPFLQKENKFGVDIPSDLWASMCLEASMYKSVLCDAHYASSTTLPKWHCTQTQRHERLAPRRDRTSLAALCHQRSW
jgi:hypothetical protein